MSSMLEKFSHLIDNQDVEKEASESEELNQFLDDSLDYDEFMKIATDLKIIAGEEEKTAEEAEVVIDNAEKSAADDADEDKSVGEDVDGMANDEQEVQKEMTEKTREEAAGAEDKGDEDKGDEDKGDEDKGEDNKEAGFMDEETEKIAYDFLASKMELLGADVSDYVKTVLGDCEFSEKLAFDAENLSKVSGVPVYKVADDMMSAILAKLS